MSGTLKYRENTSSKMRQLIANAKQKTEEVPKLKTKNLAKIRKTASKNGIVNMPWGMPTYFFIGLTLLCFTFIICFLIYKIFSTTFLFGVGSVIGLILLGFFGVNVFHIKAEKDVQLDRNKLEVEAIKESHRMVVKQFNPELLNNKPGKKMHEIMEQMDNLPLDLEF